MKKRTGKAKFKFSIIKSGVGPQNNHIDVDVFFQFFFKWDIPGLFSLFLSFLQTVNSK